MSQSDIVSFPPRKGSKIPPAQRGKRVREALAEKLSGAGEGGEELLNHLRDLVVGPHQRLSEARVEELLDILEEQDDFNRTKLIEIEAGLDDVTSETVDLRQRYDALTGKIEALVQRSDAEKIATRAAFDDAVAKLRDEFDVKVGILAETLKDSLAETETDIQRELTSLSAVVSSNKVESRGLFEQAQTSSLTSLEARIAQWRAEIDDDRKEDMEEVAASLMEIGKRLLKQRQ